MDIDGTLERLERAERDGEAVEIAGQRFTSLDRVVWPGRRLTKGDMVRYYVRVAPVLVRYIEDRPLMLKRYHEGLDGGPLFQQRAASPVPETVTTAEVVSAEGEASERYTGSEGTVYYAAQMNTIEMHAWHSRAEDLDAPDWVVLDLDPSVGAGFKKVVRIAQALRERIEALGLSVAVKTSGSRGLHLYVPTGGGIDYDTAARFARLVAERVAADEPSYATVERAVEERGYRVYIDHLQNARGKTAVAPYALRARPKAPVSMPIEWGEVDERLDPTQFTLENVPARLNASGDPWRDALRPRGDIERAIETLESE